MALPNSTPIEEIPGVDASKLVGNAQKLDKGQLIALSRGTLEDPLNAVEQKSISAAFEGSHTVAASAGASCCCTCTPCCSCCAAASIEPVVTH